MSGIDRCKSFSSLISFQTTLYSILSIRWLRKKNCPNCFLVPSINKMQDDASRAAGASSQRQYKGVIQILFGGFCLPKGYPHNLCRHFFTPLPHLQTSADLTLGQKETKQSLQWIQRGQNRFKWAKNVLDQKYLFLPNSGVSPAPICGQCFWQKLLADLGGTPPLGSTAGSPIKIGIVVMVSLQSPTQT